MRLSPESVKEQIEVISTKRPAYKPLLDFFGQVRNAQFMVAAGGVAESSTYAARELGERHRAGLPLFDVAGFGLDLSKARPLFEGLCDLGLKSNEKMREAIPGIREAFPTDGASWEELMVNHYDAAYVGECAGERGVDGQVLAFLVKETARPFIELRAEDLVTLIDPERWRQVVCPVCGSCPAMVELREEGGKRYLHCGTCSTAWRWKRLACAYCAAADSDLLGYFMSEAEEEYRVDVCDGCHSYIKTVDRRALTYKPDMVIEDLSTLHLDMVAREKGYVRPAVMSPVSW